MSRHAMPPPQGGLGELLDDFQDLFSTEWRFILALTGITMGCVLGLVSTLFVSALHSQPASSAEASRL